MCEPPAYTLTCVHHQETLLGAKDPGSAITIPAVHVKYYQYNYSVVYRYATIISPTNKVQFFENVVKKLMLILFS